MPGGKLAIPDSSYNLENVRVIDDGKQALRGERTVPSYAIDGEEIYDDT